MAHLFDRLPLLRQLVQRQPFGLFTDFDGTISEITASPGEARIYSPCHHHLSSLATKISLLTIVSGRSLQTLPTLVGISRAIYIGNHGLERLEAGQPVIQPEAETYGDVVHKAVEALREGLAEVQGVVYEDKGPVVAVHYRGCTDHSAVEARILSLLDKHAQSGSIRIGRGRMILEVQPPINFSKGTAVLNLIRQYSLRGGIYLGDDLTDIDALKQMRRPERGNPFIGVGVAVVGHGTPPEVAAIADCTLEGPREVGRFLGWLDKEIC